MAKKKKDGKNDAFTELKTLESKWLKDRRMGDLEPVQVKVQAAKVAAVMDYIEQNDLPVDVSMWPLAGAEELVKLDEEVFKQGLTNLQKIGILNSSYKFRKIAAETPELEVEAEELPEGGILTYRCIKPGGVNLADRDEYVLEDQEVSFTEEAIAESSNLQNAIANEWLIRVEGARAE